MIKPIILPPSYCAVPKERTVEKPVKRAACDTSKSERPKSTDSALSSNDVMEYNFAKSKRAKQREHQPYT